MTDGSHDPLRSALMARIRSKDTKPELAVRSMLHAMGYRFRLHLKDLPGRPDIVLPRHRKVILVHGCFWHGHGCRLGALPKSNTGYWIPKISGNQARDKRSEQALAELGWAGTFWFFGNATFAAGPMSSASS